MFANIAGFIYKRRLAVLSVGLVFIIISGVFGVGVFSKLKGGGFDDPSSESSKAAIAIHEQLGRDAGAMIVLFTSKDGTNIDSPAFKQSVETTLGKITGQAGIDQITTFYTSGAAPLVSNDHKSTYALVDLSGDEEAQQKLAKTLRPMIASDTLLVQVGGRPFISEQISEQVSKDLEKAESMTFPILAVLLIFIFGSLIASALPLAIGGIAILGAFLVLRVASNFTDVSVFSVNIITMLGLGLAIDYSLFVVNRFREELEHYNGDVKAALTKTMQTAGRTVLFSGLTVAISLMSLQLFPLMFLKSMGLGGAAAVAVAMVAALTVLPALLALLGNRVNSLNIWKMLPFSRKPEMAAAGNIKPKGYWYRVSSFVMRRPVITLVATLLPLLWVGTPFLHINLSVPDARSLPSGAESRSVSEALSSNFPRNETSPIQLVVRSDNAALDAASIGSLYDYTRQVSALPGVRRVDSLVTIDPKLDKATYQALYTSNSSQVAPAAARYAKGNYTLVSVLYDTDPLSNQSQDLVRSIRAIPLPAGLSVQVGGNSAALVDFMVSLGQAVPWAILFIVSVVFVLLFLMLGSVIIPIKAVILNTLSLSVSFGALVWIFQDGNLANILGFTPLGSVDGTQPILIFAIAFGLSMDYEVFLLSRVKEHYDRTKDTTASVAFGVQKTGAIITSAALLLFVVIAAFATGEVVFIKQIGVGLGLAILVDATVVRALLVPATMRLMGKYNWWAPAPLTALYNRLGFSEVEHEEESTVVGQPAMIISSQEKEAAA